MLDRRRTVPHRSHFRRLLLESLEDRRVLAAGDLDPSFGIDGRVTTEFFSNARANEQARDVVVQPDGKVVVAAGEVVVRYQPNGMIDPTFGDDGNALFHGGTQAQAIALQSDGKIVAAGYVDNGGGQNFALVRYNADGTLDETFDGDGTVTTAVSASSDLAQSVAVQTDGKIVVAGYARNGSNDDFAIVRYNADGTLDETFDGDGIVTTTVGASHDHAFSVALQSDGKIVAAGGSFDGNNFDFALVRYNANGALDETFNDDGIVTTNVGPSTDRAYSVALQSDGKIVAAGQTDDGSGFDIALVRYNADGTPDETFAGDGIVTTAIGTSSRAYSMTLQTDGKIVVAGDTDSVTHDGLALARYNADGTLDETFAGDGIVTTNIGISSDRAYSVALQSDGKIVAAGQANYGDSNDIALVRYNADGALDETFDGDGIVTTAIGVSDDLAQSVALQADGKVVVAGSIHTGTGYDFALARYNADGTLDETFDGDGMVATDTGSSSEHAQSVAVQTDGKIVVAGYTYNGNTYDFALMRYNPDGTLDESFAGDGIVKKAIGARDDFAQSVALQADDKIVVAGYTGSDSGYDFALLRYNANGTLDATFAGDGIVTTAIGASSDYAHSVALQTDGKIVVAGVATVGGNRDFAIVRYNADGTQDETFGDDGIVMTAIGATDDHARSVAVQSDGKIVVAGETDNGFVGLIGDFAVVRYNADGTLDETFEGDGIVTTDIGAAHDSAYSVALQADGKIVVAGTAYVSDNYDFALVRYNADGTLDETFASDGIVTTAIDPSHDSAYSVALQTDGKIVVAGDAYDGSNYDFALVRYLIGQPPVIGSSPTATVSENGAVAIDVDATDDDQPPASLVYWLSGGPDSGAFEIDAATGVVTFLQLPDFESPHDANGDNVYEFVVAVSDGDETTTQAVTVTVLPVNDVNPSFTSPATASIAENTPAATVVLDVDALDGDSPAQSLSYTLSGPDAGLFTIDAASGELRFAAAPDFEAPADAGADNVYELTVTATDDGLPALSSSQNLTVSVLPVNDVNPSFTSPATASVAENTPASTVVLDIDATDGDSPAQTLSYSLSGPDAGLFTIDAATGNLRFAAAPDYEAPADAGADNVYELTVTATDNGSPALSSSQNLAITVLPVNDVSPAFTSSATASVAENTPAATVVLDVDALDGDLPAQSLSYTLSGTDAGLFTIDAATGELRFAAAPDYEAPADAGADNVYELTVTATDNGSPALSSSQNLTITVLPVNDHAPIFTTPAVIDVDENASAVTTVQASDADLPAQTVNYSITGGADAGHFAIDPQTGELTFASPPDYELPADADGDNVYLVSVSASDGAGGLTSQDLSITVLPVNDNDPVFTSGDAWDVLENSTHVTTLTAADADLPAQTLSFSIAGGPDADRFTLDLTTGQLSFLAPPDYELPTDADANNVYQVTVAVSDGACRVTFLPLSVTVLDVHEFDYGDAPDSYGVTLAANGARHIAGDLRLGSLVEASADGQPSFGAFGDDSDGVDDEDGVTLPSAFIARVGATISVQASAAGRLDAWIDWNRNGHFETGEQIAASLPVAAGTNSIQLEAPASLAPGLSYARFRLSSAGGLGPIGPAADGEVEDYAVTLVTPVANHAQFFDDPLHPGQGLLLVRGGAGADVIIVQPTHYQSPYTQVVFPGRSIGPFTSAAIGRVVIFGDGGPDAIAVNAWFTRPTTIYGDGGNDSISGGGGDDLIFGGAGNDVLAGGGGTNVLDGGLGYDYLYGGQGRDLLIGGDGVDWLYGLGGEDLLIGNRLLASEAGLNAIQAVWSAPISPAARQAALAGSINASSVQDDHDIDYIMGGLGSDWLADYQFRDLFFDFQPFLGDRRN